MSDYLSHLAARVAGTAVTIRPRFASFYEPPPITETTPELETVEMSAEATVPSAAEPQRETAAPRAAANYETEARRNRDTPRPAESTSPARSEPRVEPPSREPVPLPVAHADAQPRRRQEPPRQPAIEPMSNPQPAQRTVVSEPRPEPAQRTVVLEPRQELRPITVVEEQLQHTPPRTIERVRERVIEVTHPPMEHASAPEPAPMRRPVPARMATPPRIEAAVLHESTPEPLHREPSPVPPAPPRPLTLKVIAEPHPAAHPYMPSPKVVVRKENAAAPDIQITIGRIEVRAVPAAEASPRRYAQPASRMSLDDYLRRREERAKG